MSKKALVQKKRIVKDFPKSFVEIFMIFIAIFIARKHEKIRGTPKALQGHSEGTPKALRSTSLCRREDWRFK